MTANEARSVQRSRVYLSAFGPRIMVLEMFLQNGHGIGLRLEVVPLSQNTREPAVQQIA